MNDIATLPAIATAAETARSRRLKDRTGATHDRLDSAIMERQPFASRERYGCFLQLQYHFHRDVDALYADTGLGALLPDLAERRRLELVSHDLADLGLAIPATPEPPAFRPAERVPLPAALGWLYVAEGSNLGAAFLLKAARDLGLSETFGARHLAGAPEGRARHWRSFTAMLDGIPLEAGDEEAVMRGAEDAFTRVRRLVGEVF